MTINIKRLIFTYLGLDLIVIIASLVLGFSWFINTQVGFFGSLLVTVLSLLSYKKMVETKVINADTNERDILDKIEDPYELYDDENAAPDADDKALSKPKKPSLKQSAQNVKLTFGGFFSPLRLVGYILFFIAFLALVKSSHFSALSFFAGISVTPLGAVIYALLGGAK